ncbi:MAG: ribonuclease J [Bacillaceae bacterium]
MNNLVKVCALGGVGEIGKNMYVVEVGEEIFILDAGVKYPETDMYGIDLVIPDISYLIENKKRVKGLFITHGHEDHIGAIPYIVRKLAVPIYGTALSIAILRERFYEVGINYDDVHIIEADTEISFEHGHVSFFKTIHSIPGSVGIVIHTEQGAIVYTGDFKFDSTPVAGCETEIWKISGLGEEGVLCLLSDSTNAEKPGYSSSERLVGKEVSNAIYNATGRVIVASFATNIFRLQQVVDATEENNRKLIVVGDNMKRIMDIASSLGYLTLPEDLVVPLENMDTYKDEEIVLLTTGVRGEPLNVLEKMAKGLDQKVNITDTDTVIIASTPIAGNELALTKVIDLLFRAGATVIFKDRLVHVSGHGSQEELKLMLQMVKPKYFIPVHGEYRMQIAHCKLAREVGMADDNIFIVERGDVIAFQNKEVVYGGKVQAGNVLIDGLGVGDIGTVVLRDRKLLSQDGILIVVVTLSKEKKTIISGPEIISRGFVYVRESEKLMENAVEIVRNILETTNAQYNQDWNGMKGSIRDSLTQFLYERTKRRPMILPIIMEV